MMSTVWKATPKLQYVGPRFRLYYPLLSICTSPRPGPAYLFPTSSGKDGIAIIASSEAGDVFIALRRKGNAESADNMTM